MIAVAGINDLEMAAHMVLLLPYAPFDVPVR